MAVVLVLVFPPPWTELVLYGVGYHHAGMDAADRRVIEGMFLVGDLPVLCKQH